MQKDIEVEGDKITGTLYFIEGGLASSGPLAGDGYFLALKFSDIDENATSVKVGLNPSQGTGLVEIIDDPDMNGVFKITDKGQRFIVECYDANDNKSVKSYSLRDLKFVDEGA